MSRVITGSGSSAYVGGRLVDIDTSAVYQLQLNRNVIGKLLRPTVASAGMHYPCIFIVLAFALQLRTRMQLAQLWLKRRTSSLCFLRVCFQLRLATTLGNVALAACSSDTSYTISTITTTKIWIQWWQEYAFGLCYCAYINSVADMALGLSYIHTRTRMHTHYGFCSLHY